MTAQARDASQADSHRRGRPRDMALDARILQTAIHELAGQGFAGFSVEGVAAGAGVSKAAIYRRFADRDALIEAVLEFVAADVPDIPPSLPVRDQLISLLDEIRDRSPQSATFRIMRHAAAMSSSNSHLSQSAMSTLVAPRRERIRACLRRGIAAGDLRRDLDVDAAVALLVGAAIHLGVWSMSPDLGQVRVSAVVDLALQGMSSSPSRDLR